MKLQYSTCIVILALSASGLVSASVAAPDPIDTDLKADARAADVPLATWTPVDRSGPAQPALKQAVQPRQRTPDANPLWAVPLSVLSSTRERPIFSSSRRPPASAVATAAAPTTATAPKPRDPDRPPLFLVGTIANGDERFGIFLNQSTAAALRLKLGEDFQGWKLSSVQGREATLEKNQEVVVLMLPQPGTALPAALSRLNLVPPPVPGQPQPRRRPNRQM
jgi:general secretion pathway protein N